MILSLPRPHNGAGGSSPILGVADERIGSPGPYPGIIGPAGGRAWAAAARTRKLADVKGKVTYNGKAVPGGMVVFQAADGFRGVGPIMQDGSYSLKSPLGQVKAVVVTRPPSAESLKNPEKRPPVREVHMPAGVDPRSLPPQKYERFETSGPVLRREGGGQTIDIPLTD